MNSASAAGIATDAVPRANDMHALEASTRFLLELGRALHTYGGSSPQIEDDLRRCAERVGVVAHVSSTPTGLFLAIGSIDAPEESQRTYFQRLEPGHVNGEKQILLARLRDRIIDGGLATEEARAELARIIARPRRYGGLLQAIAGGLASVGCATLMGGHAAEVILAGALGIAVSALARTMRTRPRLVALTDPACGFIAGVVAAAGARFAAAHDVAISPSLASFSGILTLVPGLAILLGIGELTARHLSAGTARLTGAAASLLLLCVGVALGVQVGLGSTVIAIEAPATTVPLPLEIAMTALTAVALIAFFNARKRDLLPVHGAIVLGYFGARLGDPLLGVGLGAGLGAMLVTLYSNLLGRIRRTPSVITLLPGLILLLPSSFGFESFAALLHGDIETGIAAAFSMVITALSLVTGLLVGAAALPADRATRRGDRSRAKNETPPPFLPAPGTPTPTGSPHPAPSAG